jgi:hypothetical protein
MAQMHDWLPHSRTKMVAMAEVWVDVLLENNSAKANAWKFPNSSVGTFRDVVLLNAKTVLAKALDSAERTEVITEQCKMAFNTLEKCMRDFKKRYFLSPPLTNADFVSLHLPTREGSTQSVPAPVSQASATIWKRDLYTIGLKLSATATTLSTDERARYGFRVYWGIMPQGGASVEAAVGKKRELMKIPISGDELPFSKFTRRKREIFNFDAEDSGKTVFFCIRFENSKGDPGPWGPIVSAVIP